MSTSFDKTKYLMHKELCFIRTLLPAYAHVNLKISRGNFAGHNPKWFNPFTS